MLNVFANTVITAVTVIEAGTVIETNTIIAADMAIAATGTVCDRNSRDDKYNELKALARFDMQSSKIESLVLVLLEQRPSGMLGAA